MSTEDNELQQELTKSIATARLCMNSIRMRATGQKAYGIVWPTCPVCVKTSMVPSDVQQMSRTGRCGYCESMQGVMTVAELRQQEADRVKFGVHGGRRATGKA